eukprot:jgi/Chlat1/4417/Chrsp29S04624
MRRAAVAAAGGLAGLLGRGWRVSSVSSPVIITVTAARYRLQRARAFSIGADGATATVSSILPETAAPVVPSSQQHLVGLDHVAHLAYTHELAFISEHADPTVPIYRAMDEHGHIVNGVAPQVDQATAVKLYKTMVKSQIMDGIFYEAQRQGRFSFYLTADGEEAASVASAAALSPDDVVLAQYRETGVLLWRGFTLQQCADQCFGNSRDPSKGRQMPIHYGSRDFNFMTISSPLATQIPQAVGAAYAMKLRKEARCVACYFGDGAASEGDFHAAMNFAAVLKAPVVFICRNNGWAISTPVHEQYKGDGIVARGRAYGIRSVRVDGNDVWAMLQAVSEARRMAVEEGIPMLVEAMTYRVGHHSTSDDSTRYRAAEQMERWKQVRHPIPRLRKWLEHKKWWSSGQEDQCREEIRTEVLRALDEAESLPKPPPSEVTTDVYDVMPLNLKEQQAYVQQFVDRYPDSYNLSTPH